jgi:hypothetical protein
VDWNEEKRKIETNVDESMKETNPGFLDENIYFRKRIFNLTPAVPNMESIPEDDDEESEYIRMNFVSGLTKSRRRDSVCSWNSANDSDNEQVYI